LESWPEIQGTGVRPSMRALRPSLKKLRPGKPAQVRCNFQKMTRIASRRWARARARDNAWLQAVLAAWAAMLRREFPERLQRNLAAVRNELPPPKAAAATVCCRHRVVNCGQYSIAEQP